MAEYSEFGFGMRMDVNLPRLSDGLGLSKQDILTPEKALKSIRALLQSRPDIGKKSVILPWYFIESFWKIINFFC